MTRRSHPVLWLCYGSSPADSWRLAALVGEVAVDAEKAEVHLSSIFKWYAGDFGKTKEERLTWLLPYLQQEQRQALQHLMQTQFEDIKVKFTSYDWTMNSA